MSDTLWVVERRGRIRLVRGGAVLGTDFLDIRGRVLDDEQERGLLGLAFHPGYATNGRFFVFYTADESGTPTIIAEYGRSAGDPDVADTTEVRRLVDLNDPEWNHNGGMIAFRSDGFLYAAIGDGGGGGDAHGPIGHGLNRTTLFGNILRLDVDDAAGDFAAAGNPFTMPTGLPQIWAYGLRNPWRFSFDRSTGDLYMGDVGENAWEEINVTPIGDGGGQNYGWRAYEADTVFDPGLTSMVSPHASPAVSISQSSDPIFGSGACAVIGGYVYRGAAIAGLDGWYFYGRLLRPAHRGLPLVGGRGDRPAGGERSLPHRNRPELLRRGQRRRAVHGVPRRRRGVPHHRRVGSVPARATRSWHRARTCHRGRRRR